MKWVVIISLSFLGPPGIASNERVPQEVEALIDRLRSDDPATRETAEIALVKRGVDALPALKKHEHSTNLEVRARVSRVVKEIHRLERRRNLRPAPVRLTLSLAGVPLSEALKRTFEPFGVKADVWPRELNERLVSFTLKDADLWKALDTFSAAGNVHLRDQYTMPLLGWGFRDGPAENPVPSIDIGEGRLYAETDFIGKVFRLRLKGLLPHGCLPAAIEFQEVRILDERGRRLAFDITPTEGTAWRRAAGPTAFHSWHWKAKREELKDVTRISVRGEIVITYAKDVERAELSIRDFKGPTAVRLGVVTITVKTLTAHDGYWGHEIESIR